MAFSFIAISLFSAAYPVSAEFDITKARLLNYIENFTTKK